MGVDAWEFPGGLLRLDPTFAYVEPPSSWPLPRVEVLTLAPCRPPPRGSLASYADPTSVQRLPVCVLSCSIRLQPPPRPCPCGGWRPPCHTWLFSRAWLCGPVGAGWPLRNQPHDTQAAEQVPHSGQLWCHVPGGQPQRVCTLRENHPPCLLGAQLWLPAQLLLQWLHQPVSVSPHSPGAPSLGVKKGWSLGPSFPVSRICRPLWSPLNSAAQGQPLVLWSWLPCAEHMQVRVPIEGTPVGPRVKSVVQLLDLHHLHAFTSADFGMCWLTRHFPCFHSGVLEHVRVQLASLHPSTISLLCWMHRVACWVAAWLLAAVSRGPASGYICIRGWSCVTSSSVQSFISAMSAHARDTWERVCVWKRKRGWCEK